MDRNDTAREQAEARLRQRLWGATVLLALAVIVLPLLLDGSGSESQFRRVERLREEPPRIVTGGDGTNASVDDTLERASPERTVEPDAAAPVDAAAGDAPARPVPDIHVGEDDPPDYFRERAAETPPASARRPDAALPRAWVVQAGSFRDQSNAVAVRDRLRRAGHPTFITDASPDGTPLYRVQVGPMVDEVRAQRLRDAVNSLLGRGAIVVAYP